MISSCERIQGTNNYSKGFYLILCLFGFCFMKSVEGTDLEEKKSNSSYFDLFRLIVHYTSTQRCWKLDFKLELKKLV